MTHTALPSLFLSTALVCVSALPAVAEDCAFDYEIFEYSVSHIDMEECPDVAMAETAFCRANIGGEDIHVYYFSNDGGRCLLKVESYGEGEYSLTFPPQEKEDRSD